MRLVHNVLEWAKRPDVALKIQKYSNIIQKIGVAIMLVLLILTVLSIVQERADRRAAVNTAICDLVRAVPTGNDRIDTVRKNFGCGPYIPPGIPTKPGQPTPTMTKTVDVPVPVGIPTTVVVHAPTPTPGVSMVPGPTKTVVIHGPTKTVTKTKHVPQPLPSGALCVILLPQPHLC